MCEVSVIIPTLNEAPNIHPLLTRVFKACSGMSLEVIVVDDDSVDGTLQQVHQWMDSHPVRLISRKHEKGLASAIQEGIRCARGNIMVVMDADLSHCPETIPALIAPVQRNQFDMTVGSRYVPGGAISGWPLSRRLISRASLWLTLPLTDVWDPLSGFFAVRKEFVSRLDRPVSGFKIGLEIISRNSDQIRVKEIPIYFQDRQKGRSKANIQVMLFYLYQILSLYLRNVVQKSRFSPLAWTVGGIGIDVVLFNLFTHSGVSQSFANAESFLAAATLITAVSGNPCPLKRTPLSLILKWFGAVLMTIFIRGGIFSTL